MGLPVPEVVQCPHCWARNPAIESRCRECDRPLAVYIGPPLRLPPRIGLGSVMVLVAVAAGCLAVGRLAPVLGIVAGCVAALALLRARAAIGTEVALGVRPTAGRRASLLVGSFGVAVTIFLSAAFVFFLVAIVVGGLLATLLDMLGVFIGVVAGLVASIYVAHRLRKDLWEVVG